MNLLVVYLIILNVAGFMLMRTDKQLARRKARRIPEKRLFTVAAVGGALGAWIGMNVYRHKTKHTSFTVGIPLLLLLNAIVFAYVWKRWI